MSQQPNSRGINTGTRNKKSLMDRAEQYFQLWKDGNITDWALRLGYYLGVGTRASRENYIEQAIAVGVLRVNGESVHYIGPTSDPIPEPEATRESELKEMLAKARSGKDKELFGPEESEQR